MKNSTTTVSFITCPPDSENKEWRIIFKFPKDIMPHEMMIDINHHFNEHEMFNKDGYPYLTSAEHDFYGFELEYCPNNNLRNYFCDNGFTEILSEENFFLGVQPRVLFC